MNDFFTTFLPLTSKIDSDYNQKAQKIKNRTEVPHEETWDLTDLFKELISKKFRTIKDIMRPAHFVPESMKINDLLRDFQKLHMQIAIVTNEFGATAGIVTMEDIIEELVGEIQDEHDEEKPTVEKKSETEFIVNAHSSIGDVNESLPMSIPENPKEIKHLLEIGLIYFKPSGSEDHKTTDSFLSQNEQNLNSHDDL